jgi:hypothetical protein
MWLVVELFLIWSPEELVAEKPEDLPDLIAGFAQGLQMVERRRHLQRQAPQLLMAPVLLVLFELEFLRGRKALVLAVE